MKKYFLLVILLSCFSLSYGQRSKVQVQAQRKPVLTNNAPLKAIKSYAPDLLPHQQAILHDNGKRFIKAYTFNKGKSTAKACILKVTYRWKVDYENFTKKELVKQYPINALAPNASTSIIFQVPDSQIYSHKTYGSKNVSIQLQVDGTNLIIELDENNNGKYVSLPILNH